ncbi:TIR domain-containing protein [Calothrix sp. CCY 0018]|uniref:TIR domain-containing protein n=1 Tax=Calothrix sp. CCY 0018 TaxID=3103864 RepID=UPI0039C62F00
MKHDIFLSYASQDSKNYVDILHEKLQRQKYKVWYDQTQINWGDKLEEKIREGLKQSQYAIVVLTHKYLKFSRWTALEFNHIIENNKGRIFLILHNITINDIEREYPHIHPVIGEIRVIISSDHGNDYILDQVKKIIRKTIIGEREEFTDLVNFLAAENWTAADKETYNLINKKHGLLHFPSEDLKLLNRLWILFSEQRYGFSIQKEIYQRKNQSKKDSKPWKNFANSVGWYLNPYKNFANSVGWRKVKGKWTIEPNHNAATCKGHFPAKVYFINLGKKGPQLYKSSEGKTLVLATRLFLIFVIAIGTSLSVIILASLFWILASIVFSVVFALWFSNFMFRVCYNVDVWDWLKDGFKSYQLGKFFSTIDL